MAWLKGLPRSHFKAYHYNDSLLFQFILAEFLEAYQEIVIVSTLTKKLKLSYFPPFISERYPYVLHSLKVHIGKLVGYSQTYTRVFSWHLDEGLFAKLKNNCAFFFQNSNQSDKDIREMDKQAHQVWFLCLQSLDILRSIELDSLEPREKRYFGNYPQLAASVERLLIIMKKLAHSMTRITLQFREDENVLFFLIRHRQEFDEIYEGDYVSQIFRKMFPKGIEEAKAFIEKKYQMRGFHQLLPHIHTKFLELEAQLQL